MCVWKLRASLQLEHSGNVLSTMTKFSNQKAKWNCNYYLVILFEFEVSTVPHPRDSKSHGFGYFCFRLALMAASAFFSADSETYEN